MKKPLVLAVVAMLTAPGAAAAARQSGVVVKVDRHSHVVAVAQAAGHVVRVHAPAARFDRIGKQFRVGQRISFAAHKLSNGTLAGSGFRVTGHARRVRVHGIVRTYDAQKRRITLATGGTLVRMRLARTGARALAASAPPKVGDEVTVTASVDENDDALEATEVEADDQQAEDGDAQGEDQQAQDDQQQAEQGDDQGEQDEADAQDDGEGG